MSSFRSAGPIGAAIHVEIGSVEITATDRDETSVEVCPFTAGAPDDVRAAGDTKVEYADGRLTIRTSPFGPQGTVCVRVSLPQGSRLEANVLTGELSCAGALGDCEVRTGTGDIRIAEGKEVRLMSQRGNIDLGRARGRADISSASGHLQIGTVDGNARLTSTYGHTLVGVVVGDVEVSGSSGDIAIGRAGASVVATTANGHVKVGEVVRGTVELRTNLGNLTVGVRQGTSALLDVHTRSGRVLTALADPVPAAGAVDDVKIMGLTNRGDILVHQSPPGS